MPYFAKHLVPSTAAAAVGDPPIYYYPGPAGAEAEAAGVKEEQRLVYAIHSPRTVDIFDKNKPDTSMATSSPHCSPVGTAPPLPRGAEAPRGYPEGSAMWNDGSAIVMLG